MPVHCTYTHTHRIIILNNASSQKNKSVFQHFFLVLFLSSLVSCSFLLDAVKEAIFPTTCFFFLACFPLFMRRRRCAMHRIIFLCESCAYDAIGFGIKRDFEKFLVKEKNGTHYEIVVWCVFFVCTSFKEGRKYIIGSFDHGTHLFFASQMKGR